jgi:hypothetical protein
MKFRRLSYHQRRQLRRAKILAELERLTKWRPHFAVLPRRVDQDTVVWLEYCARRIHPERFEYCRHDFPNLPKFGDWQYGPHNNILEQPR